MKTLTIILAVLLDLLPAGKTFLQPLQKRDSILIADQLLYGFRLDSVRNGTTLALPDFSAASGDTLTILGPWQTDTLRRYRKEEMADVRVFLRIAPFEEGTYSLPPVPVVRSYDGRTDSLVFEGLEMEVRTMPVDTATFVINDLKGQILYPITLAEAAPVVGITLLVELLALLAFFLIRRNLARRKGADARPEDPAHIVALRELDKFRSDKFWAPDRQKAFYSGITDALKNYIDARFGVDAPEMTTAELFGSLKDEKALTPELYSELKALFETADFVKFAKYTADDSVNAGALPLAVRFVTSTYQSDIESETAGEEAGKE